MFVSPNQKTAQEFSPRLFDPRNWDGGDGSDGCDGSDGDWGTFGCGFVVVFCQNEAKKNMFNWSGYPTFGADSKRNTQLPRCFI